MSLHIKRMGKIASSHTTLALLLSVSFFVVGCASTYKPEDLHRPTTITCIYLPTPMSFFTSRGLMFPVVETRLERGPYIAERGDTEGTFYRGPPGGFSGWPYTLPAANTSHARDGGFWIPHDSRVTPRLYSYFSTSPTPAEIPSENVNCSSFAQVKDPTTSKTDLVALAAGGAVGGALGGVVGRSMAPQSGVSYGNAAGVGAAGGAIGMLIVGAIINADVGKIILYPWPENSEIDRLRVLAKQAVIVKELPSDNKRNTVPESNR